MAWWMLAAVAVKGGMDGYFAQQTGEAWASATRDIADTNYGVTTRIADNNAETRIEVAGINAETQTETTRMTVQGLLFAAQKQYDESLMRIEMNEIMDGRAHDNWLRGIEHDIKLLTLQYNAKVHGNVLAHQERTTKIYQAGELKRERERVNSRATIDFQSLFV